MSFGDRRSLDSSIIFTTRPISERAYVCEIVPTYVGSLRKPVGGLYIHTDASSFNYYRIDDTRSSRSAHKSCTITRGRRGRVSDSQPPRRARRIGGDIITGYRVFFGSDPPATNTVCRRRECFARRPFGHRTNPGKRRKSRKNYDRRFLSGTTVEPVFYEYPCA